MTSHTANTSVTAHKPPAAHYRPHLAFWRQDKPPLPDVIVPLPEQCIDELDSLINAGDDFEQLANPQGLERCRSLALQLREQLLLGAGVAVIDRFPVERYNDAQNQQLCGVFASLLGPLMAQDINGTRLYSVKDAKTANPEAVRKSITDKAQPFHTDGGWYSPPAQFVGLFCVRSADNGGASRITSLMQAYESLRQTPETLSALCAALPWDKQGEHLAGDPPTEQLPVFENGDNKFVARFYESYVRTGYAKLGKPITPETDKALAVLNESLEKQPALEFGLQAGQLMYLNNYNNVHARGAFSENIPGRAGRFLVRVWNH